MECPYCISTIADRALVCPTCRRDLYLFKPLLARQAELEAGIAAQAAEIATLGAKVAEVEAQAGLAAQAAQPLDRPAAMHTISSRRFIWGATRNLVLALVCLQLSSWLLRGVYGATDAQLSVFTVLIALPFGYFLLKRFPASLRRCALPSLIMGVASVVFWRWLATHFEGAPFVPPTIADWRTPLEFVTGIGLGYFTGALICHAQHIFGQGQRRRPSQSMRSIAAFFSTGKSGASAIDTLAHSIQKFVALLTPAATGLTAIYTIFKAFASS